jgi:hypothetical protein
LQKLSTKKKLIVASIALLCIGGYFLWQHFHQQQPATTESQVQTKTPQGIDLAAHNAQVKMMQTQQFALLKNKPPDTIIRTVPYEVTKVVTQEVEKRGADLVSLPIRRTILRP